MRQMLFFRMINILQLHKSNPLFVLLTMGSHKVSFTSCPKPLCKHKLHEKAQGKVKIPRQEGLGTSTVSTPFPRVQVLLPHCCLWSMSTVYLDLGVGTQLSSGFSWDLLEFFKKTKTNKKTEGKESKYESRQMDRFTNPRFFILISLRLSHSLVGLALLFSSSSFSCLHSVWPNRVEAGPSSSDFWPNLTLEQMISGGISERIFHSFWNLILCLFSGISPLVVSFSMGLNWFSFILPLTLVAQLHFSVLLSRKIISLSVL